MSVIGTATRTLLDNGIEVWNFPNRLLNTASIGFMVGSQNDPSWLKGATHLAEHWFIRESKTYSDRQVNRIMNRRLGGSDGRGMGVYTMRDHVAFGHQDLLKRDYLYEVMAMFASLLRDNMYDVRKGDAARVLGLRGLEVEIAAVHNETHQNGFDFLPGRVDQLAHELVYQTNPARWPVDADLEQLLSIEGTQKFMEWISGQFVPRNMRIVFVGPTKDVAMKFVHEHKLHKIPDWKPAPRDYSGVQAEPVWDGVRERIVERRDVGQTHVGLYWPTGNYLSKDGPALETLAKVFKFRVEDELRERNTNRRGGSYHPQVDWYSTGIYGVLGAWFATVGGPDTVDDYIGRVLAIAERLKSDVAPEFGEDVDDFREYLGDEFYEDAKWLPSELCTRVMSSLASGDLKLEGLKKYVRRMSRISPRMIRDVATKYLTPNRYAKVIVRPVP